MASLLLDKKKNRWRVNYLDARGKRCRRFFQMKITAQDFLKIVLEREERIRHRLGWLDSISYLDGLDLYKKEHLDLKSKTHSIKTFRRLRNLQKFFTSKPLCDVLPMDIDFIIRARLNEGLANKTVNEERSALGGLFKWAVKRRFAVENPVLGTDSLPKVPRSVRRAYTKEEVGKLLLYACPCCQISLAVLANTGIRLGELDHLKKDDFDLERKALFITHTEATPVKGKQSRVIPLNDALVELIASAPEGKVLRIHRKTFEVHFQAIRERAGVLDAIPHGFRHTFTSHLVESGLDLGKIQRITGHQDIKTLQKYLHSTGSDLSPFRNLVQFAVPYGCPEVTTKQTNWGEVRLYGRNEKLEKGLEDQEIGKKLGSSAIWPKSPLKCAGRDSNPHRLPY